MPLFSKDLGIDLGTMFIRLADSTQVLMQEPTIVAIEVDEQKMVAVGREALDMSGRVPENIEVSRPLRSGVIADYEIAETLLSYMLQRVSGSLRVFRPRVMISVPYGVTSVERRAVYEAVMEAGSRGHTDTAVAGGRAGNRPARRFTLRKHGDLPGWRLH